MSQRREAFGAYYFAVEIDGVKDCFFRSCSGLKSEAEIQEVAEGGVNATTHKWIGRTKFPNIVLKQGFSGPPFTLWNMRKRFLDDGPMAIKRFSGTITQLGPGNSKAKWAFEKGWICKWEGPDLDASKNEISIETIEIAHEGLIQLE
jgi:phage tail-like protein